MNPDSPSLGTRELLSESDEVQPNGKIFKKAIYGKYKFLTFSELHKKVYDFAAGLSEMGVKRVCIYMETRAEWMIAAHACFQHNIQIVTVYSTLGEKSVAQAMQEAWFKKMMIWKKYFYRIILYIFKRVPQLNSFS